MSDLAGLVELPICTVPPIATVIADGKVVGAGFAPIAAVTIADSATGMITGSGARHERHRQHQEELN